MRNFPYIHRKEEKRLKVYLAIEIHRGLFNWTKGFLSEEKCQAFADEWAKEHEFESYDAYSELIDLEGVGEVDDILELNEIEVQ